MVARLANEGRASGLVGWISTRELGPAVQLLLTQTRMTVLRSHSGGLVTGYEEL